MHVVFNKLGQHTPKPEGGGGGGEKFDLKYFLLSRVHLIHTYVQIQKLLQNQTLIVNNECLRFHHSSLFRPSRS